MTSAVVGQPYTYDVNATGGPAAELSVSKSTFRDVNQYEHRADSMDASGEVSISKRITKPFKISCFKQFPSNAGAAYTPRFFLADCLAGRCTTITFIGRKLAACFSISYLLPNLPSLANAYRIADEFCRHFYIVHSVNLRIVRFYWQEW